MLEKAIVQLIEQSADSDNYDHILTPELVGKLDVARVEARTGNNMTMEQAKQNLRATREGTQPLRVMR